MVSQRMGWSVVITMSPADGRYAVEAGDRERGIAVAA